MKYVVDIKRVDTHLERHYLDNQREETLSLLDLPRAVDSDIPQIPRLQ